MNEPNYVPMERWIPWLSFVLTFVVAVIAVPIWVFTTFATQAYVKDANIQLTKYVDERHAEAVAHSDANRTAMQGLIEKTDAVLNDIKDTVKSIEQRTWERRGLSGRGGNN